MFAKPLNLIRKKSTMKEFWNERYGEAEYIYGKAPNDFFVSQLRELKKGKILLPAEGEGRNAVYAAVKGWDVTAFDFSKEGQQKAFKLAAEYDVEIDYQIKTANKFSTSENYDAIALIFAHFAGEERTKLFQKLEEYLKPRGLMIMEVFSKNQLGRTSGGPKTADLLYSKDEITVLFPNIDFMMLEETKVTLHEGLHHEGEAAVIRAVGMKKA